MSTGTTENNANGELGQPTPKTLNVDEIKRDIERIIGMYQDNYYGADDITEYVTALIRQTCEAIIGEDETNRVSDGFNTTSLDRMSHRNELDGALIKIRQVNAAARIAANIRQRRIELGYTQREFAKAIGLPQSCVARFEDARYAGYTLRSLTRLAHFLGFSLRELLDESQPSEG